MRSATTKGGSVVEEMSVAEYRRLMGLTVDGDYAQPARRKMGNVKTVIDGYTFDSEKESYRYGELKLLQMDGQIRDLLPHKTYVLQEGFRNHWGEWLKPITYTPDFYYFDCVDGLEVVEDVKSAVIRTKKGRLWSTRTSTFEVKFKLFQKRYPDIRFRIVT